MVGPSIKVSGYRTAGTAQRIGLRCGRKISRRRQHTLCAIFSRDDPAVSVSQSVMPRGRFQRSAESLLYLQQQSGRSETAGNAGNGQEPPMAEALKALTGEDKMDATAIIDYFAPLKKWLDEQNKALPPR